MATSSTYNFLTPQNDLIIAEAFERIGIPPSPLSQENVYAGQRGINFILSDWINKGDNLWTIRSAMIGLGNYIPQYQLPNTLSDVKTVVLRNSIRALGGGAFSSIATPTPDQNPALAFDENASTSCNQAPYMDGWIAYYWSSKSLPVQPVLSYFNLTSISLVGVQSAESGDYTLAIEYTLDPNFNTWLPVNNLQGAQLTPTRQTYIAGQIVWVAIRMPPAIAIRIHEQGGAVLNIAEIYFNNNIQDIPMTRISEFEYTSLPNKLTNTGRPTTFWVDRQRNPVLNIWPIPTPQSLYNCIYYTYWSALQDIGELSLTPEVPFRFLEALVSALAYNLALKNDLPLDKVMLLKADAEKAYKEAGMEDRERVPLRIYADYLQGYGGYR